MTDDIRVSVCMITYNHEPYIAQAVESVLNQETRFPLELVIGEDCSTDRTRTILESFQRRFSDRIRLLDSRQNLGMGRNFARTYASCQGQYLAMLEGDDFWTSPRKLQLQVDAMEAHPDWAVCFHTTRFFFEDGREPPFDFPRNHSKQVSTIHDLLLENFMQTCSVVYRCGLVPRVPDWMLDLPLLDWPLHVLHAQSGSIGFLPENMASYRIHSGGAWSHASWEDKVSNTARMFLALREEVDEAYRGDVERGLLHLIDQVAAEACNSQAALNDARRSLEKLERSWSVRAARAIARPERALRRWIRRLRPKP